MSAAIKTFLAFLIYSGLLLPVYASVSREKAFDTKSISDADFSDVDDEIKSISSHAFSDYNRPDETQSIDSHAFSDISRPSKKKPIVNPSASDDGRPKATLPSPAITITKIEDDVETAYEPDEEEERYTETFYEPDHFEMLTDMREIKPYFFKDFIEITPQNCSQISQLSKKYEVAFKMYTKGIWVKDWKTSLGLDPLLDLLYGFRDIATLKIDLDYDKKIETAQPLTRALQYYNKLKTLELSNSRLNDEGMTAIFDGLRYAKAPLKSLILKGNALSANIEETIKHYFPSLTDLHNLDKPLIFSEVFKEKPPTIKRIIEVRLSQSDFNPLTTDDKGNTLLHHWAQSSFAREEGDSYTPTMLTLWEERNGDLDALNQATLSPFDLALQNSHWGLLEALLLQDAGKRYYEQSLETFYHKVRGRLEWRGSSLQKLFTARKRNDSHFAWVLQRSRMLSLTKSDIEVDILTYNQGRIQQEKRYLLSYVSNQLWDNKGEFKAIHINNHRMVGRVIAKEEQRKRNEELEAKVHTNRIYFKRYPAFPGVSIAISLLQETLFGEGSLPLTFAKIKGEPYLLSPGIGRIMWDEKSEEWIEIDNLHYILEKTPERLKELDPIGLHRSQLMAMLTNPEDGKPSNYALQRRYNKGAILYGIDEEQGFVPAAAKPLEGLGKLMDVIVQMKSNLMCFDNVGDELTTLLRPIIKEWRPRAELEGWIRILVDYQAHMVGRDALGKQKVFEGLFSNKDILFKEKETYLEIPFQKGDAGRLLTKLYTLQKRQADAEKMQEQKNSSSEQPSPLLKADIRMIALLYALEPFAAQRYSRVTGDLKGKSVLERFIILDKPTYDQNQPLKLVNFKMSREELPSSLSSTHMLKSRNILPYQKRTDLTFDPAMALDELEEEAKNERANAHLTIAAKDVEQAIQIGELLSGAKIDKLPHLDLRPYTSYEQKLILTAIERLEFEVLGLRNSSEVNIKFLSTLNLKTLTTLELIKCPAIDDDILPLLETISPTLNILDLSFSPNLKHIAHREGIIFASYTSLTLPHLKTLALEECTTLESILLNASKLTSLKLMGCRSLKPFTIDAPLLEMIDARNSPWLTDGIIYEWVRLYPQLKLLKLDGNPQLSALDLDNYRRFLKSALIYRPKEGSDEGMIKLPIAALANPYEGTFDLSQCGDAGKYLSISTGYRKGKKVKNEDKVEIWLAPRFLIERDLKTTASHFKDIMNNWPDKAPVGIFWTWGGWDDKSWYDYLTTQNMDELSNNNLYEKYTVATTRMPRTSYPPSRHPSYKTFHVHFELN